MKITNNVINRVIEELAGEDVVPLVHKLKNKKNVSEFKLAESIGKEINVTRNMLYRLYNVNLVYFTRKKDKKKGWYIYYWTFDMKKIKYLLFKIKKRRLERLRERLEREKMDQFFLCPNKCIRLDFEQAVNFEFKCPECGVLIEQEDNTKKISEIEKEIKEIEKDLKEHYKAVKKRALKIKAEEAAKEKKAAKKKVVKKETKRKVAKAKKKKSTKKKSTKKTAKKKVSKKTAKSKKKGVSKKKVVKKKVTKNNSKKSSKKKSSKKKR